MDEIKNLIPYSRFKKVIEENRRLKVEKELLHQEITRLKEENSKLQKMLEKR